MSTNQSIIITLNKKVHNFEIGNYLHHDSERCMFKVFKNSKHVASFTPDNHDILHLCTNPGKLPEKLLHLLADEIEARHRYGFK